MRVGELVFITTASQFAQVSSLSRPDVYVTNATC